MKQFVTSGTFHLILFILLPFLFEACARKEKINLERIVFRTSACFGPCSVYHAQIDNNSALLLHSEYVGNSYVDNATGRTNSPDTSKTGYFSGSVRDKLYHELVDELQNIGLDNLQFDGDTCCDGSVKTIVIYYNGKRKVLESMTPPKSAMKLVDLLRYIVESTPTQRIAEKIQSRGHATGQLFLQDRLQHVK